MYITALVGQVENSIDVSKVLLIVFLYKYCALTGYATGTTDCIFDSFQTYLIALLISNTLRTLRECL
jgi:hypothetical protein